MIFNTIKRIIFLAATILFFSKNVNAQTFFNNARADYDSYYENRFGFEINSNISNTNNAAGFQTSSLVGFSTGLAFTFPLKYPVAIVPMLLYSQKGFVANTTVGRFTQNSQFIDLPVLAKINITGPFNVYAGPQASLLMTTSNKYDQDFINGNQANYEYTGSKITYQAIAGAGYDLNKSINIHARYTIDIVGKYVNSNHFVPPFRRTVIQLGIGLDIN